MKYLVLAAAVLLGCSAQGETRYTKQFEIPCSEKVKAMRPGVVVKTCISEEAVTVAATDVARERARIQPGTGEDAIMRLCADHFKWWLDLPEPNYVLTVECFFDAKKKWDSLSNEKKRIAEGQLWARLK